MQEKGIYNGTVQKAGRRRAELGERNGELLALVMTVIYEKASHTLVTCVLFGMSKLIPKVKDVYLNIVMLLFNERQG